ncbi:outer dense fiber protein 4 isoform X2 [Trachypithecus francoisi]|uniref:outer dense fiber protein 4 isoform X2 n=1 Tax=Trachypithecus francoisi TaxID=54180 RepID=UPI00141ABB6D|nr:outer dense fiber protein 4 isoform X2 [Trachypithecus francoisi]
MDAEDSGNEFSRSEGERDQHQRPGKGTKSGEAEWGRGELGQDGRPLFSTVSLTSNRSLSQRRNSPLPFQWRVAHSFHWMAQVLASELSLVAFILLLVMAFSKKWLYLSRSRFYQRWPVDVSNRIYTSAHIMSMGLLYFCKSRSCSDLENGKVTFIFSTLMLFPINIWIFEVERNVSIPIGWSYFIGWLVLILYVSCAILCYFNHRSFWSPILSHPSGTVSCSSSFGSVEESLRAQMITDTPITQEGVLAPERKDTHL